MAQKVAERYQEAEDLARNGRLTEDSARNLINEILARVGRDKLTSETVRSFLKNTWLKRIENERTLARYELVANQFLKSLGDKADELITTITYRDVRAFMDERLSSGKAPRTVVLDAKAINTAFNLARKLALIQTNPVEKALILSPLRSESSEKSCFSQEQIKSLLHTADGDWKTAIMLGIYTGARLSDCANMKWTNINFSAGIIDYLPQKTQKNGKRIAVPMHDDLTKHLQQLAEQRGTEIHICPSLAGKGSGGKTGLSESFRQILEKAKIDPQLGPGKGNRKFSKLSFHSLRHTFNSMLANAGIDQETRMRLTGHSTVKVNGDYTHIDKPKLQAAIVMLPSVFPASSPENDIGAQAKDTEQADKSNETRLKKAC